MPGFVTARGKKSLVILVVCHFYGGNFIVLIVYDFPINKKTRLSKEAGSSAILNILAEILALLSIKDYYPSKIPHWLAPLESF